MNSNSSADIAVIRESRQKSNAAILQQDVAGIAKYWMEDIVVISGEGGQYLGKDLLVNAFKDMFTGTPPVFERLPAEIIIAESGVLAWETGTWNYKTETFRGNYSAMWRKVNDLWLLQSELFVSLD